MSKKEILPEPIALDSENNAILGFVIPKTELNTFLLEAQKVFKQEPFLFATQEDGEKVKVKFWNLSLQQTEQILSQLGDYNPVVLQAGSSTTNFNFLDD